MTDRVSRLLAVAAELGFRENGYDGRGHLRLVHENGTRYQIAATPGDWKGDKNAISDMQRISGQRIAKTQHRRSRKNFTVAASMPTLIERAANAQFAAALDNLEAQAEAVLIEWRTIVAAPTRQNRDRAAEICQIWSELSSRLESMHRPALPTLPISSAL